MDLRILIADDHTLVRQALRKILEAVDGWRIVAEARDGEEAVRLAAAERPDVAVLDLVMPGKNGVEAAEEIKRRAPNVPVLMLTMHAGDHYVVRALGSGARGYVLKDAADEDLVRAVAAIAQGGAFLSPRAAAVLRTDYVRRLSSTKSGDLLDRLSEREREVFQLVAEGCPNARIAAILDISPATVDTHRSRILQKLGIHSTAELVRYAAQQRVIV